MKIGVLTGGGDAPGLNAAIRAVVVKATNCGDEVLAIKDGWAGLLEGRLEPLSLNLVEDIEMEGGTILGTSRTNPYKEEKGEEKVLDNFKKVGLSALVAIGGEDTLGAANKLSKKGLKVVGVPKTIDNDLSETDYCIGFHTAVSRAAEAIEGLHTTARSHHRVLVVEVMGRHAGWITLEAGLAGGAHIILIPEVEFDIEEIAEVLKKREDNGKLYSIVAAAEGAKPKEGKELLTQTEEKDAFGHVRLGGIGGVLAKEIEKRTGKETRATVLGHIQRAGAPNSFDRVLGTRYGVAAVQLVKEGKFGQMVSLKGTSILSVPLEKAVGRLRTVDRELYDLAKLFQAR
ncbi:6-phosphofructokinase [bacterium]|nr:6-phosphofructokinase [bacterium]